MRFNQKEYRELLDKYDGHNLGYAACIEILMQYGASYNQAKNGTYTYLHHGNHIFVRRRGNQIIYDELLDEFNGTTKNNMDCIHYLESLGFSQGQAKAAVYKYRVSHGLIK